MRQPTSESPTVPGREPAGGGPDMRLPGADRPHPINERAPGDTPDPGPMPRPDTDPPDAPGANLPERLGDRVAHGPGPGIASGEPDLVPDVEVPEETM